MDDGKPRIIDKRQSENGIEYLVSITEEWISSSTSRFMNPELVELYEWLHSSGFREGVDNLPSVIRPKTATPRGTRKRTQGPSSRLFASSLSPLKPKDGDKLTLEPKEEEDQQHQQQQQPQQTDSEADSEVSQLTKKQRLEASYIEGLDHMTITSPEATRDIASIDSTAPSSPPLPNSPSEQLSLSSVSLSKRTMDEKNTGLEESFCVSGPAEPQVVEFNRNTEQNIVVFFKEGLDAAGVDIEFIAAFFYAIVLSPLKDPTTIEAAIHVLDRALTLHGPQIFADIWNTRKRTQELLDGRSIFSVNQNSGSSSSYSSNSTSFGGNTGGGFQGNGMFGMDKTISASGLPRWNDVWDLIKAEFGFDSNKPDSKQHVAAQERHIRRMLLGGEDRAEEPGSNTSLSGKSIEPEERIIREGLGRAIVGLLLRVLEQDTVLSNVGSKSFFCRNVLEFDPISRSKGTRQGLDVAFDIIGLAMSSKFFSPPLSSSSSSSQKTLAQHGKQTSPWPLNSPCQLDPAGMETLQLGQQILLMMIRFTQAGTLFPENGLEELARETLSRLSKVNKDRKLPGSGPGSSNKQPPWSAFTLERYSLDQTEIFLKTLIKGPTLLSSGTGSGAGLRCAMKEKSPDETTTNLADESFASSAASALDFFAGGQEGGGFKSQTGICMGSSTFVMILVDLWFRSKTTAKSSSGGSGTMLNFKRVVDSYSSPPGVRPATAAAGSTASSSTSSSSSSKSRSTRTSSKVPPSTTSDPSFENEDETLEKWNAKDMEQLEWTVMMMEILIWAWVEARGIRRHEIEGTGVEEALSRKVMGDSTGGHPSSSSSGWLAMSDLLSVIGGSLQRRWHDLEDIIEVAITIEELCLR
ncbi:hypothetical protein BGZ83_011073 [Gryganskiella cystojenkinii]|nr:hypothetical protein BGZ83_011073 [Gryganskiella cystojenkinii]